MRRVLFLLAGVAAFALLGTQSASARPGDLDPTFSQDGLAQVDVLSKLEPGGFPVQESVEPVGIAPDGKVVLGANTRYEYDCNANHTYCRSVSFVAVARLLPSGELDRSFAADGTYEGDFGLTTPRSTSFAFQPDGKILVAGTSYSGSSSLGFVARLSADGTLDQSFAGTGVLTFDSIGIGAVAAAPDGRILIGGSQRGAEFQPGFFGRDDVVMRLLSDGTPDPSFGGGDGSTTVDLTRLDNVERLAIDGTGRILAAGRYDTGDNNEITSLFRLLPDGGLDSSFSGDGSLQVDLAPEAVSAERLGGLVVDTEDRPVLSVASVVTGPGVFPQRHALVRFTESGSPDDEFGAGGVVFIENPPDGALPSVDQPLALALDGQDRMLIGGNLRLLTGRRLTNGEPDLSFGDRGWVQIDAPGGAFASGLLVDPADRVVVVGSAHSRAQVARLRTDTNPPDDLDADGVLDPGDECPTVYAPGSGCPHSDRTITIRRRQRAVSGQLSSPVSACVTGAVVELLRKKKGRDVHVAKTEPLPESFDGSGLWGLDRPRRRGRYYVKVAASYSTTGGSCGAARSATLRLPPRRH